MTHTLRSTALRPLALAAITLAATLATSLSAQASCGSASCSLMTDRYAQGGGDHGGLSLDLRLELVTQNRLREGSRTITAADALAAGEEAIETRTKNTNLVSTLSYGLGDWTFAARIPVLKRNHLHDAVDDTTTPATLTPEQWSFSKLGDVQLLARKRLSAADASLSTAVFGGLKLPTGSHSVANGDGTVAERALQPGSGTTDLIVGAALRHASGLKDASFAQLSLTTALQKKDEFKPGARLEASVGWSHAYTPALGAVLQLNLRHRLKDAGAEAEPELSGSTTLDLSPGLTFAVSPHATVYAYAQLPVYQHVRGIQLVPRQALAVGYTRDF